MSSVSQTCKPGLLIRARKQGEVDVFAGKRRWVRYNLGMPIEVTTDPTLPSASWRATMHNVSGGGVGIWSKRDLPVGSRVHVRDWVEEDKPVWLPGRVMHSTLGLRGHLIGIAFDEPTPPDADTHGEPAKGPEQAAKRRATAAALGAAQSLRGKCAVGGLLACSTALIVAYGVYDGLAAQIGPGKATVTVFAVGSLVGVLIGWMMLRRDVWFLGALQTALRDTAAGKPMSSQLAAAPCTDLAALARAFQDLGARWQQREHDERAQRQKLEEITRIKTNILSIVSHDLRTPLTSILLYTEMLKEQLDSLAEEDKRSFIGIVCDECTRLSRLVDDLLEVQRLESDRAHFDLQPRDLAETIQACGRLFVPLAQNKSMSLAVLCPPTLPPVAADPDKIAQAVNNLISNALKYTPSGGTVNVSAEVGDAEVLICVADNGPGIPRDKWDHIFDRFSQLADPNVCEIAGFGLGLYIVSRVVEAHGGRTWLDSEPGKGAAFFVALPVAGSDSPTVPEQRRAGPTSRVLVCDSDPELAAAIAQTVRAEGFDVRIAHSGHRLLQQLDDGDIDVLVTDIVWPDMDAAELLDALNALADRSFRTIVHTCDGDGQELKRRGVDLVLRRPVSKEELMQAVHVALQKRSAAGLTVVLVEGPHLDTARLSSILLNAGHMTMVADSLKEAATLAREYGGDLVVVSGESLTPRWAELRDLRVATKNRACIVVLCETLRKREKQLESEQDVIAVAYRPGREEEVFDVIMESESEFSRSPAYEPDHRL